MTLDLWVGHVRVDLEGQFYFRLLRNGFECFSRGAEGNSELRVQKFRENENHRLMRKNGGNL